MLAALPVLAGVRPVTAASLALEELTQPRGLFVWNAALDVDLPLNFSVNTNLDVTVNGGLGEGYNQAVPIWSASVSKFLMKNKRLQLTLAVHDLLNRNVGISRSANLNYVEDERIASLGRYGMLRLTYALNSMGPGGGPRVRMMFRR